MRILPYSEVELIAAHLGSCMTLDMVNPWSSVRDNNTEFNPDGVLSVYDIQHDPYQHMFWFEEDTDPVFERGQLYWDPIAEIQLLWLFCIPNKVWKPQCPDFKWVDYDDGGINVFITLWRKLNDIKLIAAILKDDYVTMNIPIYMKQDPYSVDFNRNRVPLEYRYQGCRYVFRDIRSEHNEGIDYDVVYRDPIGLYIVDDIVPLLPRKEPTNNTEWEFIHFKKLLEDYGRR